MYQYKLLVALASVAVALVGAMGLGGCRSSSERITYPDGRVFERKDFELKPNFIPGLVNYDVKDTGLSNEGLRMREWTTQPPEETIYEVEGQFFTKKRLSKPKPIQLQPLEIQINQNQNAYNPFVEYRVSADLIADSAELVGLTKDGNWQTIIDGDMEDIAIAAMKRGLGAMEFENEFGSWQIVVDSPIPVVVTRLNGEIVDVRGVNVSFGSQTLMSGVNEACR